MRRVSPTLLIALVVLASAFRNQSVSAQTAPAPSQNQTPQQPHPRSPGGDVGSGAGDVGKGTAKGAGAAAEGVGKGAAVTGKDVGVGAAKGTGKIAKGTGRGVGKIFHHGHHEDKTLPPSNPEN